MHDAQMKIVEDFLQGNLESQDPAALFLKKRHATRMEELKAVKERHAQVVNMVAGLEKQGVAIEGALQECVAQLAEVLSVPDPKDQKEQDLCDSTDSES